MVRFRVGKFSQYTALHNPNFLWLLAGTLFQFVAIQDTKSNELMDFCNAAN